MTLNNYTKLALGLVVAVALPLQAQAQSDTMEEVTVTGITPNQGASIEKGKIPYNIQGFDAEDMERAQSQDITDYLDRHVASVTINSAANNPLQQDVQFRGYSASPLLGLAQGISVYQNGVRINEPLGDSVNWDLLPQSAIHSINVVGGANPLYGLNTLGGAMAVTMKNGFNSEGTHITATGGSFERILVSAETGGNNGNWGYYGNVSYFDEDGWRDESPSDAINFYGSLGWRSELTSLNLNYQHGDSELIGNGAIPTELNDLDREAIFTAPDRTENNLHMFSMDLSHAFSDNIQLNANGFYRRNKTNSFNGDGTEFAICELGGVDTLVEGIEEDDLEELGLDDDDVCESQFADADALEDFLNMTAIAMGEDEEFNVEDLTDELEGTGVLSDEAINNISDRTQKSYGTDIQLNLRNFFSERNQLIVGVAWFEGKSSFNSVLELADLNPVTRSTVGLGTGTFVEEAETEIKTETETFSFYFSDTFDLTDELSLTFSGRLNNTMIELADQSGERPELNGEHDYFRFNPAVGLTYRPNENMSLYGGYNESSRAPTPIELACNDSVFNVARAAAIADGEDPDDIEFECRLPNAFLADPPLEQVVTKSFEIGARGNINGVNYHVGFFHSENNNDILFQTTGRATGLFANVDKTRRLGFESAFNGSVGKLDWFLAYSYLEATFEDDFEVLSPNHPFEDDDEIDVEPGDRIPGLPKHSLKLGADFHISEKLSVGFDVRYNSNQTLRGDESDQLDGIDGYAVVNLRGRYRFNDNIEFFARIDNLFDNDYENFGLLGEEPSEVEVPLFEDFEDPTFVGPGAPIAGFVGARVSF